MPKNAAAANASRHKAQFRGHAPATRPWTEAVSLYQAGRLNEARAACQALLGSKPIDGDALHKLGLVAFHSGGLEDASRLIERAIELKPDVAAYRFDLGSVHLHLGQFNAAIDAYREAVRLDPKHAAAHNYLGGALQSRGRLDEAVVYLQKAIALQPDYAEAHYNLANTLKDLGKPEDAVVSYRKAVSARPDYAEAHYNLGNTLKAQGKQDEAIACYRNVLSLEPGFVEAHINLGFALQHQRRLDEAMACYRNALTHDPGNARAHYNLGIVLSDQGKPEEAMACLHKALALEPDYAEAYNGIGGALLALARPDQAVVSYHKALALKPDFAEAHCNLGTALEVLGKLDAAADHHHIALSLKPDFAEAHIGLAAIFMDRGQFEEAQDALLKALDVHKELPVAWAMLIGIRKMTLGDEGLLNTALRLALKPTLSDKEKCTLQFAIGKYYDDTRQYDLAFSAYQQANALQRRIGGRFDRAKLSRLIDTLIATYSADFLNQQHEGASQSQRPVLIVGMPRSGTSLTEQIIASHPKAFGAGELPFWEALASSNPAAALFGKVDAAFIARVAAEYEQLLQQYSTEATRVVDKMPINFFSLGLVHAIFPQARIVHMQRNPVDTCLSIYFQHLNVANFYGTDLDDLGFFYREYARLMRHWRTVLPGKCLLEVPYEALTEDQAEWSRRIIEFINLDWDERCLDFHKTERKVGTSSNWQVKQKIYQSSRERWRHYESHLGPLLDALGEENPYRKI